MRHQLGSSCFRELFDAALRDYEKTTNITLTKHPLAKQIKGYHSIGQIITLLQDQAREFGEPPESDTIEKSIRNIVSVLSLVGATITVGEAIDISFPPAKALQTGFAILLVAAKGVTTSYNPLLHLLKSMDHLIKPLDIYTQIPHTPTMDKIVFKIMMEILSALSRATKDLQQGGQLAKAILGEKDSEEILRRLDRLSQDEARTTALEILKVIYGLVQDINGKPSRGSVRESLEILHQIVSHTNKSKRGQLQKTIRRWLPSPDPWENHRVAHESRHEASAAWFVQGETFSEWKSSGPSGLLWINGKPGAGKSVFCSTIVEEIEAIRKSGLASLVFFYHDFRDNQKRGRRGLLSSALVQLCHQSDSYCNILTEFYLEHGKGSQHPGDSALARCLMNVLKLPEQAPVYLIIDALDECPNTSSLPSPREDVLKLVGDLIKSRLPNLRICVTSRPETDIRTVLEPLSLHSVSLHDERGQMEDIENFVKFVVTKDPQCRRWKAEDKQLVIDALKKNADGMFRRAYCQMVYLRGCHPGRIRHALSELPETLDETYERTLRDINKENWELAHRLFQCVAVASRPLRVDELAGFLAFDSKAGPIAKLQEGWQLQDPVDAVLSTCPTLLTLANVDGSPVIQFSHFSVKEFLTSTRLAEADDKTLRRYHISLSPAHTLVAHACLGILLHLDRTTTRDSLKQYPLTEYAARHWFDHVRFEDVSQNTEDGMKQLFDPRKPHLGIWIWICDPRNLSMGSERAERPSSPKGTPLHYAAVCGLHRIGKFLAISSSDLHSRAFDNEWTPLHVASAYGHVKVTRVLLEQGADVTVRDSRGKTPLHVASRSGHVDVARFLIEQGADPKARDNIGQAPLACASGGGHVEMARFLVEHGADAKTQDNGGGTALHVASSAGSVEVVRFLIGHGLDATGRDHGGVTPLHRAIDEGNVKAASFLVENGADPTARTHSGRTPLHLASAFGYIEVARILIKHGADTAIQDIHGLSPLHKASAYANIEIARMLVEHGADVTARATDGQTPLHSASSCGDVKIAQFLVDHGADVTVQDNHGLTPWDVASSKGQVEMARFLSGHSAYYAKARANDRWSPLHLAAGEGDVDTVRILIGQGADATVRADDGRTPLHVASSCGSVDVVRILIKHGADPTARANDGRTPLHEALSFGHVEVARFLYAHSTDSDMSTTRPAHGGHHLYYLFLCCLLVEVYLRFM